MARPPTKAVGVILKHGRNYIGVVVAPESKVHATQLSDWSDGPHEALGKLRDKGYEFSKLNRDVPKWIVDKCVSDNDYLVYAFAFVTNFKESYRLLNDSNRPKSTHS